LDDIGTPVDDINGGSGFGERLEIVNVTTGSNSTIDMDELRADKSTISTITVMAGNDSFIQIEDIHAQDISEFNVTLAEESKFVFDGAEDIFLVNQGDNFVVKGAGFLGPVDFDTEAFAVMDFSGMTVNGVDIDWQDAVGGSKVTGTKFADSFDAGNGNDNIDSGLGNDDVTGGKGNDVFTDAGGNNDFEGDQGNDTINLTLGKGTDLIQVGWRGPANFDTVNGFDTNADRLRLDLSDIEDATPAPNVDDVIQGNGAAVNPGDAIVIQTIIGKDTLHLDANVFTISGTKFSGTSAVETAIELGGSHEFRNTFIQGPAGDNDAFIIQWQDDAGNSHVSTATVDSSHFDGGFFVYNFQVQDLVVLNGVPVANQVNFEYVA